MFISMVLAFSSQAQSINWTKFEDLNDSLRKERKPVMIFIHTDWCKFCKMQDSNTFSDSLVTVLLNKNYYCLRLDAEERRDINFLNRKYSYKPSGVETGYHELAEFLAKQDGNISFPSTVLLSKELQLIKKLSGFYRARELHKILADHALSEL
jgi:uncharacterized protein YyaL (SSP411 family)